jgi:hypothetical protein
MVRTTILTCRGSVRLPAAAAFGSPVIHGVVVSTCSSEVEMIFVGILAVTSEKKRAGSVSGDCQVCFNIFMKVDL